ncbi:hypothetical protein F4780DRAFT_767261 [Xylariomycetidae sp. FL0641]|nr:hypothetical protein F4780DRAFT_767261 [Xylariomycetidae sp. FL0641]
MGQNSSQPEVPGFPNGEEAVKGEATNSPPRLDLSRLLSPDPSDGPEFVFSYQPPRRSGSAQATPLAPKLETQSSPTTAFPHSSPEQSGDMSVKMADTSSNPLSPGALNGSHESGRKRKSKKAPHMTHPEEDRRPFIPHSSIDLDAPAHADSSDLRLEAFDGGVGNVSVTSPAEEVTYTDPTSGEQLSDKQRRRLEKRARKEQRQQAKLAKQQQELQASRQPEESETMEDPAQQGIWGLPGSSVVQKFEAPDSDSGNPTFNHFSNSVRQAREQSPTQHSTDLPKKRKRKPSKGALKPDLKDESAQSHEEVDHLQNNLPTSSSMDGEQLGTNPDQLAESSTNQFAVGTSKRERKKRKRNQHATKDADQDCADGQVAGDSVTAATADTHFTSINGANKKRQHSNSLDLNGEHSFADLAQSLYSGRKNKRNITLDEYGNESIQPRDTSPSLARAQRRLSSSSPAKRNGIDTKSGNHDSNRSSDSDHMDVDGAPDDISSNDVAASGVEADGNDDNEQQSEVNANPSDDNDEEYQAGEDSQDDDLGGPLEEHDDEPEEATEDAEEHDEEPGQESAVSAEEASDEHEAADNDAELDGALQEPEEDQIEVPSSLPPRNNASPDEDRELDPAPRTRPSTGRKRFVKQAFFNKDGGIADESKDISSPSGGASSARKRRTTTTEQTNGSTTTAGPSRPGSKPGRQPKISTMLKGGDEDKQAPMQNQRATAGQKAARKTGRFSDYEWRNISEAVEKCRAEHGLSQFDINEVIHAHPKSTTNNVNGPEMWDRIASTCPGRSRQKVINGTRKRFHNFVARGAWTPAQHQELQELYERMGKQYASIGQMINRHPEDVRDRIRNYVVCGDKQNKSVWSPAEEEKLLFFVNEAMEEIQRIRLEEDDGWGEGSSDEELVDWSLISEKMEHARSRLQCLTKWKQLKARRQGCPIDDEVFASIEAAIDKARQDAAATTDRERSKFLRALKGCNSNAESRIPWLRVRSDLLNQYSRATLMVIWFRLKQLVPDRNVLSVSEILDILLKKFKETKELQFPEQSQLDLAAEYATIERRLKLIMGTHKQVKTPHIVVKSDDEGEAAEENGEEAEEVSRSERDRSSIDNDSAPQNGDAAEASQHESAEHDEDEVEIEDSQPQTSTRRHGRTRKSLQASEIGATPSKAVASKATPAKAASSKATPGKATPNKTARSRQAAPSSSKKQSRQSSAFAENPRPSARELITHADKLNHRRRPTPIYDDDEDEVSSDTNASEAEDIPAR